MHLTGLPYIAGTAQGRLHMGMTHDPVDKILVIKATDYQTSLLLPAGFVVIDGAPFAHANIPLLGTGVPTIFIKSELVSKLPFGREVIIDGAKGYVTTELANKNTPTRIVESSASTTRDLVDISLRASIRDLPALQRAVDSGADAIGLVRSEFLLPDDGSVPDTEFYRQAFRSICTNAAPMPVTIRLLDIGGDKLPAWLPSQTGIGGPLGLQGVRLFNEETVHRTYQAQLVAIDELSSEFDLRVLIPFLSNLAEVDEWSSRVRQELTHSLPLGAMAETPAAALQIADWFEALDFVALGCNDLMQCLFGADRDRPALYWYLDPYAPALYRFLRQVAIGAADHLQKVQLCGVLPQLPGILPVMIGLGFRVFSVEGASLPYLRQTILSTSVERSKALAQQVCDARDSVAVRQRLLSN
ncbi:MAG: phosphoenolpyruvate-protein phosphotransferase [Gammaproteobacteria bacterium]|nr:phosphoenolpyruvate-protein phosphotransferase [Gammaproteobacteria bacterium]